MATENTNPPANNPSLDADEIEQATGLLYFLHAISKDDEMEDTLHNLRKGNLTTKGGLTARRLIEFYDEAHEQMGDMDTSEMYKLFGFKMPKATSQPRKAVRTAVKNA